MIVTELATREFVPSGFRPISLKGENPEQISFEEWFGNSNPVELEIGCGKGKFLISRAQVCPEINFIGLDWAKKWVSVGAERSTKRNFQNLRFLWVRASEFIKRIPKNSLSVVHIYFPDPWPKRRHHERRLIQSEFLDELFLHLKPGGLVEIATDFEDYFLAIRKAVQRSVSGWSGFQIAVNRRIFCPEFKTNYEIKYEAEGKPLYYMELRKP